MKVWCHLCGTEHETPLLPWGRLGSSDFCPKGGELMYDEVYDDKTSEVTEYWYFTPPPSDVKEKHGQ